MPNLSYDDSQLRRLFAALDPRKRREMFRSAFVKTASKVRKVARENLRASGLHNASKMTRGVRTVIFKRQAGFRVTVAGVKGKRRKGKSMYVNSRGQERPVLQWAEPGTGRRKTRGAYRRRGSFLSRHNLRGSGRGSLNRGRMPRYGFMSRTRAQVEGSVGNDLQREITESIERITKKYGIR